MRLVPHRTLARYLAQFSIRMPKQKTHSGAKKRFKTTGTGKVKARHAMSSHILGKKSPKRKRDFANAVILTDADVPRVKRLLGGSSK
ncbi:MAG: 50S ribosomal protein L35 [Patulibacter sp.]